MKKVLLIVLVLILTNSCKKDDDPIPFTEGTVADIEGNVYKTIQIEIPTGGSKGFEATQSITQTWMAENLKTTMYSNGDLIGTTTPATLDIYEYRYVLVNYQWAYGGNETNVDTYGRLYTWGAVTDNRNICPTGWHVPTKAQWTRLAEFLGGEFVEDWEGTGRWSNVGSKLKEAGTAHWVSPNSDAVNSIGFTALPGGLRDFEYSIFSGITSGGHWWSATEDGNRAYIWAWGYAAFSGTGRLSTTDYYANSGLSVRCIKD